MDAAAYGPQQVAHEAARAARTLQETAALTARASSPDGLVGAVADAGGRVVQVDLDARLLRDPDGAGAAVAAVLDEALGTARAAGREAALAALPPSLRSFATGLAGEPAAGGTAGADGADGAWAGRVAAARAAVADRLEVEHHAASPDGRVSVTVTGAGRVVAVRLRPGAGPADAAGLGALVTATANTALAAAADDVAAAAAGGTAAPADLDAALEAFSRRMDGLVARLDDLSARLDGA